MGLWDKIKEYGSDAWESLKEAPVDTVANAAKVATSDAGSQFVKGLAGKVTGMDITQTEENFDPAVVDAIRKVTRRALQDGRRGTAYEDYDNLPDGTPMGEFVRSSKARGGVGNFMELFNASPDAQAAFSVGRGSIEVTDDGDVYFTDKYNFSGSSSNKGKDSYSALRSAAGRLMQEDEGDTTGNTIRIYVGKEEDILGREVKKGDTLGKIAKDMGVSVQELADYNGIKDVNRINVGQRIAKPPAREEVKEEVVSADELMGTDNPFKSGIL
jgi:LysM repeat protein